MKLLTLVSAFVVSAVAAPTPRSPSYFTITVTSPGAFVDGLELTARAGRLQLGAGPPNSYCPPDVACSGQYTVFEGGYSTLNLGVLAPGGQQVYVGPNGVLQYTAAGMTYIPTGSIVDKFSRTQADETTGTLEFAPGFVACPWGEGRMWQVYGRLEGIQYTGCVEVDLITHKHAEPGAWKYWA